MAERIKLRYRVTIERATTSQAADGQPVETWSNLSTIWCHREWVGSGNENETAQRVTPTNNCLLTVREHIDVKETDRIIDWNNRTHQIEWIQESPENRGVMYKVIHTKLLK